ncbi:MAG: hypothetical protein H6523_15280 [Mycolicibacterium sp.]|nr:hypothetical protein [Mycolicibacterium sp.]
MKGRRGLAGPEFAEHIKRVVDAAPPLTVEQRSRLVDLLRPARLASGGAA